MIVISDLHLRSCQAKVAGRLFKGVYCVFCSLPDVCLSFPEDNSVYVDENDGFVSVCLILTNIVQPTLSEIWADVVSSDDTAMGKCWS